MNKKERRKGIFLLCAILVCNLLAGCSTKKQNQENSQKDKDEIKIGFTIDTLVLERWIRDRDVFTAVAQELGAEVDVQNANNDLEKQKRQIRDFVEEKMDVIVIVAVDSYGLTEEVDTAREKGIKVISYDRLIQGTMTDLYITVDNESVGEEMAKVMMEKLPDGGNIVMICGPESDANSQDVGKGFERAIKESQLHIVKKTNVNSWKPETGQDADLEACQRIVEGTQTMTVYKPIERLAKVAAKCAVKLAKGEQIVGKDIGENNVKETNDGKEVPYWGLSPIAVTKENMDSVIIDLGFHLRDEVYLNVSEQDPN